MNCAPSPSLFAASWRFALACTWAIIRRFALRFVAALRFALTLAYITVALGLAFNDNEEALYLNALGILMILAVAWVSRRKV